MNLRVIIYFLLFTTIAISGCLNDQLPEVPVNDCDTTFYQREIRSIIVTNCSLSGCHDGTNSTRNYNLYEDLKHDIEEEEHGQSEFLYRIDLPDTDDDHMPNNGLVISPTDRTTLQIWINNGYSGCDK